MSNSYTWETSSDAPEKLDPYSRWLLETEGSRFRQSQTTGDTEPWFLSLGQKAGKNDKKTKSPSAKGPSPRSIVWEPDGSDYRFELTQDAPDKKRKGDRELFVQLAPLDEEMIAGAPPAEPLDADTATPAVNADNAVIVGLIDDGINIAHEQFVDGSGDPRIDFAWVQDGAADSGSTVLFGREFTQAQIKSAREDFGTEEETLRALGLVAPSKKEATTLSKSFSHGTFVLDCLAGYPRHLQATATAAPDAQVNPVDRRIVSVQLHRRVTEESSGALYPMFAIAGLQYIVDRARRVAKKIRKGNGRKIPLVVNFSYGISGGPHNGEHLFEQYVDQLVTSLNTDTDLGPLIVPMPTGNRHLLEGHAHIEAEKTETRDLNLNWIIQPQDRTPNYLEIWVPRPPQAKANGKGGAANQVSLTLEPPFGARENRYAQSFNLAGFKNGEGHDLTDKDGTVVARVSLDALDADNAKDITKGGSVAGQYPKVRILVALAPTYPSRDGAAHIPPGVWSVKVQARIKAGQYIEAWIQRDDSPPQFRRLGRQSYLERRSEPKDGRTHEALTEFLLPVEADTGLSRYGAINGLATGQNMLRVSGVRHYDGNLPALYSGATHKGMRAIEVAAPSDRSGVFRGIVGSGGRSGSSQVMNGTSVSAPIVGRAIADFLSHKTFSDAKSAIDAFLQEMTRPANPGTTASPRTQRLAEAILAGDPGLKRLRTGVPVKTAENPDQPARQGSLRR